MAFRKGRLLRHDLSVGAIVGRILGIFLFVLLLSTSFVGSGQTTIWSEDFSSYADDSGVDGTGNIGDYPGSVSKWEIDASGAGLINAQDFLKVNNTVFQGRDVHGTGVWQSEVISITAYENISVSGDFWIYGGRMESTDSINFYYRIDGGSWISISLLNDDFSTTPELHSISALNGNSLELKVEIILETGNNEIYAFDNILVEGTLKATPYLTASQLNIDFGYVSSGGTSVELTYDLAGFNLTGFPGDITINAPTNFEVSLTGAGVGFGSSVNVPFTSSSLANTTVYLRFKPTELYTIYSGNLTNNGGGATNVDITLNGTSSVTGTQTFSTNGTFVVPADVYCIDIAAWGGGGGGGEETSGDGGGGGGGGGFSGGTINVRPGDIISVTLGTGGTGATNNNNDGQDGGNSIVVHPNGATITANGGAGGQNATNGGPGGAGGNGLYSGPVYSPVQFSGGDGGDGDADEGGAGGGGAGDSENGNPGADATGNFAPPGGNGGSNFGGNGGNGGNDDNGQNGSPYGGGGGASGDGNGTGGDGGDGVVILEWGYCYPCVAADIPTISASENPICTAETATLSISSGNLNDDTQWQWYSGSCGGTALETGTSIIVSPTTTTTYYVRGEGSCDAIDCAEITITVNDPDCNIIGNTTACPLESNISFSGTAGMTSYVWSITSGDATIDSPANTESITVDAGMNNFTLALGVTDASGCSKTCSVDIIVSDGTDPVIMCPADINETVSVGGAGRNVTWSLPSVSDNCDVSVDLINTNVPTKNPGDYFNVGTSTLTYQATDDVGNISTCSFDITVSEFDCSSQAINASGNEEWIAQIDVGIYSNSSGASNYTDFTSEVIDLENNSNHSITLTPGFLGTTFTEYWKVWIDFNQDGDFSDSGEELYSGNSLSAVTGLISIPDIEVSTTMRVAMQGQHSVDDLTAPGGNATSQYIDWPDGEDILMLVDNDAATKYLSFNNSGWVQYQFPSDNQYVITKYSITSANDAEERDPLDWTLQGSNDGSTWTTVDSRTNEDFPARFERREFVFTNNTAYEYYRLNMTNNSGLILQIAEWELFEDDGTPEPEPCETFPYGEVEDYTVNILPDCNAQLPTLSVATDPVCPGSNVTINILGNLNEADEWVVYSGSCGGTQIGTTTSSSFDISNLTSTTTFFIRGEGGCFNPGSCGFITITVDDVTKPTITCPGDVVVNPDDPNNGVCTASSVTLGTSTTNDNCGVASVTNDAPVSFPIGNTTVVWTVTDNTGLTATCQQTVTVEQVEEIDIRIESLGNSCQSGETGSKTTITWDITKLSGTNDWTFDYTIKEGITTVDSGTGVSATGNTQVSYEMDNQTATAKTYTITISNVKDNCGVGEINTANNSDSAILYGVPNTSEIITN